MSIKGIRDNIKTALVVIPGLRVYDTVPDVLEVPCAFVKPMAGEYDMAGSASIWQPRFEITLLVSRIGDVEESQDSLDDYIEPTGAASIKAAAEAGSYGSNASDVRVTGFRDYGGLVFNGVTYIGVKFDAEALV